jgi:hypothetical protein
VLGALAAAAVLVVVLSGKREAFATSLASTPVWVLVAATLLQLVALLARTEAWHVCVGAAGGTIARRRLYRAAGIGYLGSQLNSSVGTAARIAALRRAAPTGCPKIPALVAAEVPILVCEGGLAAIASYTLVGPLNLPWWVPLVAMAVTMLVGAGLHRLCRNHHKDWRSGLAVLRSLEGRNKVVVLVLVAVFSQIFRNWLMLRAVGVHANLFDATAVLIAMVLLAQLPIGPSVGAGAVVLILGSGGVAAAAAAGVLLTATGTAGALLYVSWAGTDKLLAGRRERAAAKALAARAAAIRAAHLHVFELEPLRSAS